MDNNDKRLLSLVQYMESRRKEIDKYVEGEHKWFGCLDSTMSEHSMYERTTPWYLSDQAHLEDTTV